MTKLVMIVIIEYENEIRDNLRKITSHSIATNFAENE